MTFANGRLIDAVFILTLILLGLSCLLVALVIARRIIHDRAFRHLDDCRARMQATFEALRAEKLEYGAALEEVRALFSPRYALALEQILLERLNVPDDHDGVRRVAEDLGLVALWQRRVGDEPGSGSARSGLRRTLLSIPIHLPQFLYRARNAENLGLIRHEKSWRLLVGALQDPHRDVQSVALRSLAAIGEPCSFPLLVEHLRAALALQAPRLSERELRAALACFPLQHAGPLLPLLEDTNPRLRRLAAEIAAQMVSTQGPTPLRPVLEDAEPGREMVRLILTRLVKDPDEEVRARAAVLLGFMMDERAPEALRKLLNDEVWFVRLHAVRALAARQDADCAVQLSDRLTDLNWRVREAATRPLAALGPVGVNLLLETFLSTTDVYAREQIAEVLETTGELARMVRRTAEKRNGREWDVLQEILSMGKSNYLQSAFASAAHAPQRTTIMARQASGPDPPVFG